MLGPESTGPGEAATVKFESFNRSAPNRRLAHDAHASVAPAEMLIPPIAAGMVKRHELTRV